MSKFTFSTNVPVWELGKPIELQPNALNVSLVMHNALFIYFQVQEFQELLMCVCVHTHTCCTNCNAQFVCARSYTHARTI